MFKTMQYFSDFDAFLNGRKGMGLTVPNNENIQK